MPWSPEDASRFTKKARTHLKRKKWAKIANAVLRSTGDEGTAVRVANSKVESYQPRTFTILEEVLRV